MPKLTLVKHLPKLGRVLRVSFAAGANRIIVSRGGAGTLLLDAASFEEVGALPSGATLGAMDPAGTIAAVSEAGTEVRGTYTWEMVLWDLARARKLASIATCTPDDKVSIHAMGPTRMLGVRKRRSAYSLCLFDHVGKRVAEHALGKVPLPFHAALSRDERLAAHAYFTGAAHLCDLSSGKGQKLSGGTLRVGRQHDKGISRLEFSPDGEHVFYTSHGSQAVHVWSVAKRKPVAGAWSKQSAEDAFFVGSEIALVSSGSGDATVSLHDVHATHAPRTIKVGERQMCFAQAGDDKHLVWAARTAMDVSARPALELWDLTRGKRAAAGALPKTMKAVGAVSAVPGKVAVGDLRDGIALYTY